MASDSYVVRTQDDFAESISDLLPIGTAWPRDPDSEVMQTVNGLAGPWADVAVAADILLRIEGDPRTALLMLPEWEESFGLPDTCLAEPLTINDRHNALLQRMTIQGAQSRAFFIEQAAAIGYTIRIIEYSPFQCGISSVGDTRYRDPNIDIDYSVPGVTFDDQPERYRWQIGPPEIRFVWTVVVSQLRLSYFHCGSGQCGVDPLLRLGLATDLECLIRRWKPAHTEVIFDYSGSLSFSSPLSSGYLILGLP